jgi:hypothetical protein
MRRGGGEEIIGRRRCKEECKDGEEEKIRRKEIGGLG